MILEGIDEHGRFLEGVRDRVMAELRRFFRPEFLNRVDETVLFKPLLAEQIARIVDIQLGALRKRLADRKIELELTGQARTYIADAAYDPAVSYTHLNIISNKKFMFCILTIHIISSFSRKG